jgi:hypothetical protein
VGPYNMGTGEFSGHGERELRASRLRILLAEETERFNNELLPDEERIMLLDRIKRLRRAVETGEETVDAVHSALERL